MWRKVVKAGLVMLLIVGPQSHASIDNKSLAPGNFKLTIAEGRISASVKAVPLGRVLKELGRQANIRVYVSAAIAEERVSVGFTNKPLAKGIKKLLTNKSYALTYDNTKDEYGSDITALKSEIEQILPIEELRVISGMGPMIFLQNSTINESLAGRLSRKHDIE